MGCVAVGDTLRTYPFLSPPRVHQESENGIGWQEIQALRNLRRANPRTYVPCNAHIVGVDKRAFRVSDAQSNAGSVWVSHFGGTPAHVEAGGDVAGDPR